MTSPTRKTARFIATESAQSGLKLAEDGKLPELRLKEPGEKAVKQLGSGGVNPFVLFGAILFSLIASVALVFIPTESANQGKQVKKQEARNAIEENYFAGMDKEGRLEPYQILLRDALLAHSRSDFKGERRSYRKVLDMLRTERGKLDKGLTGSPKRDEDLEKLVTTLLSD